MTRYHPVQYDAKEMDIYIGRGNSRVSKNIPGADGSWGNPFVMKSEKDRTMVIEKHKHMIYTLCQTVDGFLPFLCATFKDKYPGCFCYPKRCHGEIFVIISRDGVDKTKEKIKEYLKSVDNITLERDTSMQKIVKQETLKFEKLATIWRKSNS